MEEILQNGFLDEKIEKQVKNEVLNTCDILYDDM